MQVFDFLIHLGITFFSDSVPCCNIGLPCFKGWQDIVLPRPIQKVPYEEDVSLPPYQATGRSLGLTHGSEMFDSQTL